VFGPKIKKGVKFLGRMIGKKKDFADIVEDAVSERAEERPEGAEASVFCSLHDNSSYNPRHAHPPAYIKVRSSGKKEKDFNRMFLAQELQEDVPATQGLNRAASNSSQPKKLRRKQKVDDGAIWATAFSNDGKFLAAGGQDKVVRVWAVLSSPDERQQHERDEDVEVGGESTRLNAPVFRQKTVQVFEGHMGPSWTSAGVRTTFSSRHPWTRRSSYGTYLGKLSKQPPPAMKLTQHKGRNASVHSSIATL